MSTHGAEQGRLEPDAILISAFEIEIRRPGIVRFIVNQGQIARARLEPHVEDVGLFLEFGAAAMRTASALRKDVVGFRSEPGIGA